MEGVVGEFRREAEQGGYHVQHVADAAGAEIEADRGLGIPAHEQRAIFSKFHRGEEARIRGIKGTGIGLAMVQHTVRAHRGRVERESEPGAGSTFTIVLPAVG